MRDEFSQGNENLVINITFCDERLLNVGFLRYLTDILRWSPSFFPRDILD